MDLKKKRTVESGARDLEAESIRSRAESRGGSCSFPAGALVRPFSRFFPEGRPRMSDVTLLSGISELSLDSTFLFPLLFFVLFFPCSFCLVIFC